MSIKRKLTEKQKRFVKEYVIDYNATKSAQRAGYSEKTAYSIGNQLLNNIEVQKALQKQIAKLNDKVEASAEEAIRMCRDIALIDSRDYVEKRISKGIELYGRTQAAFVEKIKSESTVDLTASRDLLDIVDTIIRKA